MKNMWYRNLFFKYSIATILVLLTILLISKTAFLLSPIFDFLSALFCPLLIASILYYVLRPGVKALGRYLHLSKPLSILFLYGVILILLGALSTVVIPTLAEQLNVITTATTAKFREVKDKTVDIMSFFDPATNRMETLQAFFAYYLNKIQVFLMDNLVTTITTIAHCAILMFITPFILYYFLKDDQHLFMSAQQLIPIKYRKMFVTLIQHVDFALGSFITGQLIIALIIGILLWIGYSIIGLESAFLLALFASIFFTIPIIGSIIALIPALLVGIAISGFMAVKVLIVMFCVLVLESNLISPQVMSHRLHIHPLVLVLVMLASGTLYGIVGLFLATPIYAVAKVVCTDLYHFYKNGELLNGSNDVS